MGDPSGLKRLMLRIGGTRPSTGCCLCLSGELKDAGMRSSEWGVNGLLGELREVSTSDTLRVFSMLSIAALLSADTKHE